MPSLEQNLSTDDLHPIDLVECLADSRDWDFDRVGENRIALAVTGVWTAYAVSLTWSAPDSVLRLLCTYDLAPPADRMDALREAMDMANERCWTGAFCLWPGEDLMVWRYGLTLAGGGIASAGQIDAMMLDAITACERFHPAFQLVAFDDADPEAALEIAIHEAYGRA
ncbi:MAG: hypothetical protein ACJAVS_002310 [Paracoccaceae bacterium]|jgi:hypothetical protein